MLRSEVPSSSAWQAQTQADGPTSPLAVCRFHLTHIILFWALAATKVSTQLNTPIDIPCNADTAEQP